MLNNFKSLFPFSFEWFLAKRMMKGGKGSFSKPIMLISILSIVMGMMVMIISIMVLTGFKKEIREKISGFTAHIHITNYDSNNSVERSPISQDSLDVDNLKSLKYVKHIQPYVTKAAIIRTNEDIHGVVVKGVNKQFESTFFKKNLIQGRMLEVYDARKTNDVLISETIANLLNLKLNDLIRVYFANNDNGNIRGRRWQISGIYSTSIEEFDENMIIADMRHLQKLNDWTGSQVTGLEVFVDDFENIAEVEADIYDAIPYNMNTETVQERYPQIFDWLNLQDINVIVILILIILVATVSMISTLLVLIIERTQMIGILKSMGSSNKMIRKIFLLQAANIIIKGLFFGNLLGIGLGLLQKHFGLIKLDPGTYYMSVAPINIDIWLIFLLNIATLTLVLLFMTIPVIVISRITPVKAIRFD